MKIFGYELKKSTKEQNSDKLQKSPVTPNLQDGALVVDQFMRQAADTLQYTAISESELITRYREMSLYPHCDSAIDDIVNEAISVDEKEPGIELDFSINSDLPVSLKKKIIAEFQVCLDLLNFKQDAYKIFRTWYIDGRIFYHALVKEGAEEDGIQELRYIDPRQIKKIVELDKEVDPESNVQIIKGSNEFFVFNQMGLKGQMNYNSIPFFNFNMPDLYNCYKLTTDSVIYAHSGIVDKYANIVYSHLHKAMRPLNQLKMMEDASVIYRITRAPERRIFKVDVAGMPHNKAVQFVQDMMNSYRNNMIYNHETGEVQTDKQFYSMQEDFWLAVKDGATGSSIDTLPGGQNLGEIADIEYFQRKFYQSLNVPIGRLDSQNNFNVGRVTEITRDEVKFYKFIVRLRQQFSQIFMEILKRQLLLKRVVSPDEWEVIKNYIYFIFSRDNYFGELKEQELMLTRLNVLQAIEPHTGKYYSHKYIRDTILKQSDALQKTIDKQIKEEKEEYLEKTEDKAEIDLATADSELEITKHKQHKKDGNVKFEPMDSFNIDSLKNAEERGEAKRDKRKTQEKYDDEYGVDFLLEDLDLMES